MVEDTLILNGQDGFRRGWQFLREGYRDPLLLGIIRELLGFPRLPSLAGVGSDLRRQNFQLQDIEDNFLSRIGELASDAVCASTMGLHACGRGELHGGATRG